MGIYNPGFRLERMLTSIIGQVDVKVNLIIGNDGTNENEREIVERFTKELSDFRIVEGPKNGPKDNFMNLLQYSTSEYIAFADQDDIWLPQHLINSCLRLNKRRNEPSLTFCSSIEWNSDTNKFRIWPSSKFDLRNFSPIFQNPARGCTQVFNSKLRALAQEIDWKDSIMHDWHLLLIAYMTGYVSFESQPEMIYCRHESNYTDITWHKRITRGLKFCLQDISDWNLYLQMQSISKSLCAKNIYNLNMHLATNELRAHRSRMKIL